MRKAVFLFPLILLLISATHAGQIAGEYLETRSADVYTGACFANGEAGLVGDQAILAWHVRSGSWQGVGLEGLSVVAAVKAQATLGDPGLNPYPAQAVLIVDQRATPAQRQALAGFAAHMGGELLAHVKRVVSAPIDFQVLSPHPAARDADPGLHHAGHGRALLRAGSFVTVETRGIGEKDHLCGNEKTYYPPLTRLAHAMPAVALTDEYSGPGLGVSWTLRGKRSAFVGSFEE